MRDTNDIGVIVPVLDDANPLARLLDRLSEIPEVREVVVVDGGSRDDAGEVARSRGARWFEAKRGRGSQLNRGAAESRCERLWFLHADSLPSRESGRRIGEALSDRNVAGGAFRFCLAEPRWYGPSMNFLVGLRSGLLGLPFGDQGLFVRREVFLRMGGFVTSPVLEDVDFVFRLKKEGGLVVLGSDIRVSSRRWDREGVIRRTVLNWWVLARYFLGASPESLARHYRPLSPDLERPTENHRE